MNNIKRFFSYRKTEKAREKWNKDVNIIINYINSSKKKDATFYWSQLVWQEITMYIKIGEQVRKDDFNWLVNRRGFDKDMINYLRNMLIYVGLGKNIKGEK